jgi:microcystin-dependent protein
MAFAMNSAPTGWLVCNGQAVNRAGVSGYPALFAAIGTTYGAGDNSTTFNLPDLRGYFVRGSGTNGDGTVSGVFGAKQSQMFQTHGHSASSNSTGDHNHSTGQTGTGTTPDGPFLSGTRYVTGIGAVSTGTAGAHSHTITVGSPNSGTTGSETRPVNIAMLYCIKF